MPAPPRRSFLAELKRRHVYRVSAMYAAVAFVVWQVADILVSALDLPSWIMTVVVVGPILTFPFAVVLAWAYELTPDGIRRTADVDAEAPDDSAAPHVYEPPPRAAWRRLAVGGLAAVVIAAGAWWTLAPRVTRTSDLSEVTLAVFPFAVRGNDELGYLREGVVDLLSRNLSGALELQPLDPSLMLKVTGGTHPEDVAAARAIARRVGAGQFVTGSVNASGGKLRIDATLYELSDSVRSLDVQTVTGDTTQLFDLIDQLTAKLLAGRTTGAASARLIRTAAATTSSLPALKAYLEGEHKYRLGEHADAADAFQRALAEDSTFVLARYRLAISYHMRFEHHPALREVERVLLDETRLSAHDRRVARAFYDYHSGAAPAAEEQLRTIIRDFPRDLEARVILAELLSSYAGARADRMSEAKTLLEEVLAADPKFACVYCALAFAAEGEGDVETAERMMRLRHGSQTGDTTRMSYRNAFNYASVRGDTAQMRATYALLDTAAGRGYALAATRVALGFGHHAIAEITLADAARRSAPKARLLVFGARLAADRGQWRSALARYDSLLAMPDVDAHAKATSILVDAPQEMPVPSALLDQLLAWDTGKLSSSDAHLSDAWPPHLRAASRLYFIGVTASRLRNVPLALIYVDSLVAAAAATDTVSRKVIMGFAHTVRADLALRADQPQEALRELQQMDRTPPPALLFEAGSAVYHASILRGHAHRAAGEHEAAVQWLQYGMGVGGWPESGLYATYHRDMAHSLDALGRTKDAIPHYVRFVTAWKDADPDLKPQVEAANRRLSALSAER